MRYYNGIKKIVLISLIVAIVASVGAVSAGWFGPDTVECEEFSVEVPEMFKDGGEAPATDPVHTICLHTGLVEVGELYRNLDLSTQPFDMPNATVDIAEEYNEGDLKVMKAQFFDDNGYGYNYTYAEFNKDGKHFYLNIDVWSNVSLDEINLTDDVKVIKEIKDSIKFK